jgi:RNA polymerase sigma factor for flagellar operon FliA
MHMRANLPAHVDVDDLVHAGILCLLEAANKFDSSKHVMFFTLDTALRARSWTVSDSSIGPRGTCAKGGARSSPPRGISFLVLRRSPTEAETAFKLGINVERLRKTLFELRTVSWGSASNHTNEGDLPFANFPSKLATQPDSMFASPRAR